MLFRSENSLDKILKLSGKNYNYIHDEKKVNHNGYIAQEVQTVVPNIVLKDMYGNLFVNYIELIPLITDSIGELNKKVEALESEMKNMKSN